MDVGQLTEQDGDGRDESDRAGMNTLALASERGQLT